MVPRGRETVWKSGDDWFLTSKILLNEFSLISFSVHKRSNPDQQLSLLGPLRRICLGCHTGDNDIWQTTAIWHRLCQLCHKVSGNMFLFLPFYTKFSDLKVKNKSKLCSKLIASDKVKRNKWKKYKFAQIVFVYWSKATRFTVFNIFKIWKNQSSL